MVEIYKPTGADPTSVHETAQFKLGSIAVGQDNRKFVYVQANGAIDLNDFVTVDENFQAAAGTTTTAAGAHLTAWAADIAYADNEFGWLTLSGANFNGNVLDGTTADAQLYTTATAGHLSTDSSTGDPIAVNGVVVVTVRSGAGATELLATYPVIAS